ncbi:unnamed protein product [Strongylus vulgaris]|uniref:Uncharacterized protein n=1 Tax=Strongylus vulgaris TaxID=40348 RepID=A0A3P7KCG9_STRVU|nr:unnamed protein product [Strongylus vulgaris]
MEEAESTSYTTLTDTQGQDMRNEMKWLTASNALALALTLALTPPLLGRVLHLSVLDVVSYHTAPTANLHSFEIVNSHIRQLADVVRESPGWSGWIFKRRFEGYIGKYLGSAENSVGCKRTSYL